MDLFDDEFGHQVISLNALTGLDNGETMCIKAKVKNAQLIFLIDTGSSCNFIAQEYGEEIETQSFCSSEYGCHSANGEKLQINHICIDVFWQTL